MAKAWWWVTLVGVAACGDNLEPELAITGQLWADTNGDGLRGGDEPALADVLVYIDIDADPSINAGDPTARTAADGSYRLIVPRPGSYTMRVKLPFGFRLDQPSGRVHQSVAPIIGGTNAPDAYGFMVAVGEPFGDLFFENCGGVLIDERHVVTAAHCSVGASVADSGVLAGTLDQFGETGEVLAVERITVHPQFTFAQNGSDIAVWTLVEAVPLEDRGLTTIEMLDEDTAALAVPGTFATTIGWGAADRDNRFLLQVHLPVVEADDCAAVYAGSQNFDTQICAGVPEGGIGPCFGDSGGPLLVRDDARQVWMEAGITSYGDGGCANPGSPTVFGRVSELSAWAKDQAAEIANVTVTLDPGSLSTTRDLPARPTTRSQVGPIAERWQLTGMTLPGEVSANTPVDVRWRIIGESPSLDGFSCHFQADVAGGGAVDDLACGLGTTEMSLPGFPTGIFASALAVTRGDVTFTRRVNVVAGTPQKATKSGVLTTLDGIDPDFSFDTFRIDYFDVGSLTGTKAFEIEAAASAFTMFLTLYDLDQRDFATGGGSLAVAGPDGTGTARLIVVPDAGRHYLVGVSSLEANAVGAYTVSIVNDGALAVH